MKNRNPYFILFLVLFLAPLFVSAQEDYKTLSRKDSSKMYIGSDTYQVVKYDDLHFKKQPKNVILMIGDGMGLTQVFAAFTANHGDLNLTNFKNIGFSNTRSASDFITDSGAGGTALSTGTKTYNGAIGVDVNKKPLKNIRETFEDKGKATGVVVTCAVTHATPASFVAHQTSRNYYEAIAKDYLKTNVDVFIGGGYKHFTKRADGADLTLELKQKGYQVLTKMDDISKVTSGKLAGLVASEHIMPVDSGRGNMLEVATETALTILSKDADGFFLMVEGSQIDWGGHQNELKFVVSETLDFDKAIGKALAFAAKDGETLVVVTADHETGGLAITSGDTAKGNLGANFGSDDHTAVMVPVYAFGPGAEQFQGFMDNTDIPKKILQLVKK
jgi:alkaline phosphatase